MKAHMSITRICRWILLLCAAIIFLGTLMHHYGIIL